MFIDYLVLKDTIEIAESTQTYVAKHYTENRSIGDQYLDGVSLTHGHVGGRQHIWTFAVGLTEEHPQHYQYMCPCDTDESSVVSPPFVGNDYFCESGYNQLWPNDFRYDAVLFADDPLWEGQNCTSTSICCQFNNPPWFTKNLTNHTTDDIELRLCVTNNISTKDTALELIELHVK